MNPIIHYSLEILAGWRTLNLQLNAAWLLLAFAALQRICPLLKAWVAATQWRAWLTGMLWLGAGFYPLALGFSQWDPYGLGYDRRLLWLAAAAAIIALWRYPLISIWLALAALGHAQQWGASTNLWDYLFDPIGVIVVLVWWLIESWRLWRAAHAKRKKILDN